VRLAARHTADVLNSDMDLTTKAASLSCISQ
jgi:hypothetical protein